MKVKPPKSRKKEIMQVSRKLFVLGYLIDTLERWFSSTLINVFYIKLHQLAS